MLAATAALLSRSGRKPSRGSNPSRWSRGAAHPVEAERALRVAGAVPGVHVPVRKLAARSRTARRSASRASPRPPSGTRSRRAAAGGCPRSASRRASPRRARLEARPSAEGRTRRRSPRACARTRSSGVCASAAIIGPTNSSASRIARASSGVSLGGERNVSPKSSFSTWTCRRLELGVHGVAAAAEVDEVQELEVLLERLGRDVEALDDLGGRDDGLACPRRSGRAGRRAAPGAGRSAPAARGLAGRSSASASASGGLCGDPRQLAVVPLLDEVEIVADEPPELRRGERHRAPVLAQDPRGELPEVRVVA